VRFQLPLVVLFASFLCFFAHPVFADDSDATTPTGFGISGGVWISPNLSGQTKSGVAGTEISLRSNLGLTNQTILVPHFYYRWAHGQIFDFRYDQFSETMTTALNVPESFQGISFPAGRAVTTNMKVQWADLSYELPIAYDQFPPQDSYLNALVDIKAIRGTFTMTDAVTGASGVHPPITVPFPLFGLHGRYRVHNGTDFDLRLAGIRAGFEDALGWSYDLEAGVTQQVYEGISITGKYRYFTFYNRDANDNRFGFRLYGPEVDANVHF